MKLILRIAALAAIFSSAALAAEPVPTQPLPDADLAEIRGGFALPGGGSLTIGVVTDTYLNGVLVVRSAYSLAGGVPTVRVSGRPDGGSLSQLDVADGRSVATADGNVTLVRTANGTQVQFRGDRIDVTALTGQNLGTIVQNGADDRTIGVITNIDIGLSGVARDSIGSSLAQAGTLALDATTRLAR